MDSLRNIWHFARVAQAGSFTAAAAELGVSTPALSKSVARLERHVGTRLFVRTSRTLHLTDEGRMLLGRVVQPFNEIERSFDGILESGSNLSGVVRLSTVTAYGKHCVLPLLAEFFDLHPRIDVVMSLHDRQRGLSRQAFDVRITWGEAHEQDKISRTLCSMPLIVVASPKYLRHHGTPQTPPDLERHECINVTLGNGTAAHWVFVHRRSGRARGQRMIVTPKGRLVVTDELDAVADAAIAGLGLTVSSMENVLGALREGTLVQVLGDYEVLGHSRNSVEVVIQYARGKQLSPRVRVLVDFLLERLRGRNPLSIAAGSSPDHTP